MYLYRHKRCIQKLLEANADIRLHDNEGLTAVSTSTLTTYVTGFVKRGLIHTSDLATLMSHNFVCDYAVTLQFSPTLV